MSKLPDNIRRELEDLCMEHECPSSERRVARLEEILKDHPEAQDEYCRLVMLGELLKTEFSVEGVSFAPLVPEHPKSDHAIALAPPPATKVSQASKSRQIGVIAVSLALVLAFGVSQLISPRVNAPSSEASAQQAAKADPQAPAADQNLKTLLPSLETIGMLHRVTRTSWRRPAEILPKSKSNLTVKLVEGAVRMPDFNGQDSGGYLLKLPPDGAVQLTAYADAGGKNALAIMELDRHGEPTGDVVSFGNHSSSSDLQDSEANSEVASSELASSRIKGLLGSWSEVNSTDSDKYYLLTGLQNVDLPGEKPDWFVADCTVFLNMDDLLYLGWDDTGRSAKTPDLEPDMDYNDITTIIRIKKPQRRPTVVQREARIIPRQDPITLEPAFDISEELIAGGYHIEVLPGERVIANVTSESRFTNSLALVETGSGEVWWHRDKDTASYAFLGVFLIENTTEEPLRFSLVAQHLEPETNNVLAMRHKSTWNDDFEELVGFDDSRKDNDWNDFLVKLYWLHSDPPPAVHSNDSL